MWVFFYQNCFLLVEIDWMRIPSISMTATNVEERFIHVGSQKNSFPNQVRKYKFYILVFEFVQCSVFFLQINILWD